MDAAEHILCCNLRSGRALTTDSDRGGAETGSDWNSFASYDWVETRSVCFERTSIVAAAVAFETALVAAYEGNQD